jgi:hypothetical protein
VEDGRVLARDRQQLALEHLEVSVVGHADLHARAQPVVGDGQVVHLALHEVRVRNHDGQVVARDERGRAPVDADHAPLDARDVHPVAHADRALEEEHDAREEVVDEVLHAEADADADDARDDGHRGSADAEHLQRNEQPDEEDEVVEDRRECLLDPDVP